MAEQDLNRALEVSAKTDLSVLLAAKEKLKRLVLDEPLPANLAALERVSKLVENAMQADVNNETGIKDYRSMLAYAEEQGRKVKKTKLFQDIKKGLLKKQPDGSFRKKDADRYLASLPMAGTGDLVAEKASDRQRRKEEQEIRRITNAANREEFDLEVKKGKFIPREQVHLELAARAVTLATGLKTAFEAHGLDIIALVDGNPKKAAALIEFLEKLLEESFNEYSRPMEFEIEFIEEDVS